MKKREGSLEYNRMPNGKLQPNVTTISDSVFPKKIGVIYSDVKREYFPTEEQYITEKDAMRDAEIVAKEIEKLGISTKIYPGNEHLSQNILSDKPDLLFNLVDSVKGNEYLSSTIPGILDTIDVPYTGAGLLGLALTYNKFLTKILLKNAGVPVPNFQLFNKPTDPLDLNIRFPLISKLNEIHGAVEITKSAVSENERELRDRLKFLMSTYNQPVIVEEFIAGREITCMVLEGPNTKVYMGEKVFNKTDEKYVFITFEDQWIPDESGKHKEVFTYQKYEEPNLKDLTKKAFEVLRMAGYGKFDVRLDNSGRYFFIDSNTNPAFGPKETDTAIGNIIQGLYGVSFQEILSRLIHNTLEKEMEDASNAQPPVS